MGFEEVTEEINEETNEETSEEVKEETAEETPEETKEEIKPEVTETTTKPAGTPAATEKKKKDGKAAGIVSLILGILSCTVCMSIGLVTGLVGAITGIVSLAKKTKKKALAIVGLITSIIGMILNVVMIVIFIAFVFGTVATVTTTVGYLSNTQVGQIVLDSADEIEWSNPVDSFKQALIDNAKHELADAAIEKGVEAIIGGAGLTIDDGNGNTYTIQGDSLREATFTDDQTGLSFGFDDIADLTGVDVDSLFDEDGNLSVEAVEDMMNAFSEAFYDEYGEYY